MFIGSLHFLHDYFFRTGQGFAGGFMDTSMKQKKTQ